MINEQEIEKLWQAFKVLDVDGNGCDLNRGTGGGNAIARTIFHGNGAT